MSLPATTPETLSGLRAARAAAGVSLRRLAVELGLPATTIQYREERETGADFAFCYRRAVAKLQETPHPVKRQAFDRPRLYRVDAKGQIFLPPTCADEWEAQAVLFAVPDRGGVYTLCACAAAAWEGRPQAAALAKCVVCVPLLRVYRHRSYVCVQVPASLRALTGISARSDVVALPAGEALKILPRERWESREAK